MIDKTREIILKVLYNIDKNGAYSNIALNQELEEVRKRTIKVDKRNIGFMSSI